MRKNSSSLMFGLLFSILLPSIQAETIPSGINFQLPIRRTDLFDQYTLDSSQPIILSPSLVTKPSLPAWLKFIQPREQSDGFLYGTPKASNIGVFDLEIVALNLRTYESVRTLLSLMVHENHELPAVLGSFFISNQNLADLLSAPIQQRFLTAVNALWGQGSNVVIQSLTSAKELGLPVPLNPSPEQKFGVGVTVGAQQASDTMAAIVSGRVDSCGRGETYSPPDIDEQFLPTFIVDWCNVSMNTVQTTQPPSKNLSPVYLGGEYNPPAMTLEDSDHFMEFIWLLVLPCSIMACFILILGYMMCCGRRGRKEGEFASEMQLTHHRTLRHASRDLRTMSNRRDGTASVATLTPIGTPTVASQRPHNRSRGYDDYPWTSTPQVNHRGMATPPPYRTPLHPRKHRETSFSNQSSDKRRLSEPSNARGVGMSPMRPAPPFMGSSTSDRGVRPRHV